jgi:hypothetical protein
VSNESGWKGEQTDMSGRHSENTCYFGGRRRQGPEVRGKGAGIRKQESGIRSQESEVWGCKEPVEKGVRASR